MGFKELGIFPTENDADSSQGNSGGVPQQAVSIEIGNELKRGFKSRHVNMFAIAGSIGTGLIIGSGAALTAGGPASILIAYCIMGLCVFFVMTAFAEMAIFVPMNKGFSGYATRFCDPALGFVACLVDVERDANIPKICNWLELLLQIFDLTGQQPYCLWVDHQLLAR